MAKISEVFIIYSSEDRNFVGRLTHGLKGFRINVWCYEEKTKVGDSIPRKISQGLIENQFFTIVLSKNSAESRRVKKELNSALCSCKEHRYLNQERN
jgi:hypothetical protein